MAESNEPKASKTPEWEPPVRDPGFAVWLWGILRSNYGPPLEGYEIIDQLKDGTGFSEAELCGVLGLPEDAFADPMNPNGDEGGEREDWWNGEPSE